MSLKTYQNTQQAAENLRQTEYRLFAEVTKSLIDACVFDKIDPRFHKALHWNRELWTALSTDCAVEGNRLPDALRGQIVSLAIWVSKYSSEVARGDGDIQDLIDINRIIMEGLSTNNTLAPKGTMVNNTSGKNSIKI